MNKIDVVVSDLCNDVDRLTAERDEWKRKCEEVSKKFNEFVMSSIKNGEETWMIYLTNQPPRRFIIAWENVAIPSLGGIVEGRSFFSRPDCQRECEKMDAQFPGIRHWPEEI